MVHTRGLVIKIKEDGMAQVVVERKSACSGCSSTHHCHSCLSNSKTMTEALNSAGAKEGDLVDINLESGVVLKGAVVMYLIPIVSLLIGALTGLSLRGILGIEEATSSIIFGITGLFLGFMIVVFISKWMSAKNKLTPTIGRIIKLEKNRSTTYSNSSLFQNQKACSGCH